MIIITIINIIINALPLDPTRTVALTNSNSFATDHQSIIKVIIILILISVIFKAKIVKHDLTSGQ